MDAVVALTRLTLIGAAMLVAFIGYREYSHSRLEEERRQSYATAAANASVRSARLRSPPQPPDDCPVCLEAYFAPIEILPCGHIFHRKCLKSWFDQRLICPVCKGTLTLEQRDEYRRRLRN